MWKTYSKIECNEEENSKKSVCIVRLWEIILKDQCVKKSYFSSSMT